MMPAPNYFGVQASLAGTHCIVVGSAPMPALIHDSHPYIVAVNGGIYSCPGGVNVWMVNSRNLDAAEWSPAQRRLSRLMLQTGAGRTVPYLVLLTKHPDAGEWTRRYLQQQGTRFRTVEEINNFTRREIETAAGARTPDMTKHALSAGLFACAWCFYRGATTVRLEGASWEPGYAYLPGERIYARGHAGGDKEALRRLASRYPGRFIHSLHEEQFMAKQTARPPATTGNRPASAARPSTTTAARTPPASRQAITGTGKDKPKPAATSVEPRRPAANRPTVEQVEDSRAARDEAIGALTPKAERERKIERQRAIDERPSGNTNLQVIATEMTFYNNKRRRPGELFELRQETDYRESCMRWADAEGREAGISPIDRDSARKRQADLDKDEEAEEIGAQLDENEAAIDEDADEGNDNPLRVE